MVQKKNYNCEYGLGERFDTADDKKVRSKDIRAFFNDLFEPTVDEPEEVMELLHMLDGAISDNVYGEVEEENNEELPFPE